MAYRPTAPETSAARWHPSHNPWVIAVAVMAATFMEILDTSVANVALPHIAGNLSATTEEATWVLTSYLVSNAIVLPSTGWLGMRFGRKRLLTICISIFTAASVLCGMAPDLGFLIVLRGHARDHRQPGSAPPDHSAGKRSSPGIRLARCACYYCTG